MSRASEQFAMAADGDITSRPKVQHKYKHQTPRDCPRVTIRLSEDDHARLTELADGMALSTYIRAQALNESIGRQKRRSGGYVQDQKALAQVLGLLGQSRIANNLNQLAYHANIGTLDMDNVSAAQIEEAYRHISAMRGLLIKALGSRS